MARHRHTVYSDSGRIVSEPTDIQLGRLCCGLLPRAHMGGLPMLEISGMYEATGNLDAKVSRR
jgi:hypothetical protein